jgi:hypothetical protein
MFRVLLLYIYSNLYKEHNFSFDASAIDTRQRAMACYFISYLSQLQLELVCLSSRLCRQNGSSYWVIAASFDLTWSSTTAFCNLARCLAS